MIQIRAKPIAKKPIRINKRSNTKINFQKIGLFIYEYILPFVILLFILGVIIYSSIFIGFLEEITTHMGLNVSPTFWLGVIVLTILLFLLLFFPYWLSSSPWHKRWNKIIKQITTRWPSKYIIFSFYFALLFLMFGFLLIQSEFGVSTPLYTNMRSSSRDLILLNPVSCSPSGYKENIVVGDNIVCQFNFVGSSDSNIRYSVDRFMVNRYDPSIEGYVNLKIEEADNYVLNLNNSNFSIKRSFRLNNTGFENVYLDLIIHKSNQTSPSDREYSLFYTNMRIEVLNLDQYNDRKERRLYYFFALIPLAFFSVFSAVKNFKDLNEKITTNKPKRKKSRKN
jgi:hypothetical protein